MQKSLPGKIGAVAILYKPIEEKQLFDAIERAVG
jgi:FixJ family two-component response regulator